jgi:hypothetical protein
MDFGKPPLSKVDTARAAGAVLHHVVVGSVETDQGEVLPVLGQWRGPYYRWW